MIRTQLSFLMVAALVGCNRQAGSGPPDLKLGRHECMACGMLVSEDRCSSAMVVEIQGRREHQFFDDLGCMLDYEREGAPGVMILERYAHDFNSREWVAAPTASFLFADHTVVKTPMGSGIVAFAARSAAESAANRFGGRVLNFPELAEARRVWMEERYGRAKPKAQSGGPG